ncbi:MAG: hypothetical protein IKI04_01600, partial [Bacilli bacterium]|nr:hypothetical protein [Bacilli bacterium]
GEFVSSFQRENSGVTGDTVYVNDAEADLNYYLGLNYTYTSNATLPTGTKQNLYNESTLVETKILYSGTDINYSNLVGYVSNLSTERQNKYIYYNYYPINDNGTTSKNDDYITIELIDNPFADRPNNKGFNGWITNYSGAEVYLDSAYYVRYAKVPVSYNGDKPNAINITFNASWIDAEVSTITTNNTYSWSNALSAMNSKGMIELTDTHYFIYKPYDMTGYYLRQTVPRFGSCAGLYNNNNVLQNNNCTCNSQGGCTYYRKLSGEYLDENLTYYYYQNGFRTLNISTLNREVDRTVYINGYFENMIMAGYYTPVRKTNGQSIEGLYNNTGVMQHGNCSGTCNLYQLIQYRDSNNAISYIDGFTDYYYLVTRDTNIIVLGANLSRTWSTSNTKPFTFTALNNGSNSGATWTVSNIYPRAGADLRIEHMTISSGQSRRSANPPSGTNTTRTLYGMGNNVKIGRHIEQSGTNTNFSTIVGGTNDDMGSSRTNLEKYKLVIESGVYNAVSLTNGALSNNYYQTENYVEMKGVYGNDYDRVAKDANDRMNVYYCASGSWGGEYYASTETGITFDLTVKNGVFGDLKSDNTNGIYVGGRYAGTHYTSRRAKIEGGYIFNLIGGPLTASSRKTINDSYIYVTGGEVDMIVGGAGQTATYGNRIIQVTGGTVNYSVFGGSNGSDGSEGDGTVNGSSFIYIGGKAEIGKDDYVEAFLDGTGGTLWGAEAGSVFGIGNGKQGSSTIGSSDNSHIIIADSATVNNSVYGGGNFGATGVSSS